MQKSQNTVRSYAHHLKLYFEFLEETGVTFLDVSMNVLAEFIGWLRRPYKSKTIVSLFEIEPRRSASTVNTIISCVISFYEYLSRSEQFHGNLSEDLFEISTSYRKRYKEFLHHITKGIPIEKNRLKLTVPKRRIKVLSEEEISRLSNACTNIRDKLLLSVLYDGGLRISEALSLWIEDFDIGKQSIRIRNSKTASGEGREVFVTEQTMNLFQDYLIEVHANEFDTNFVFVKLRGINRGQCLDYRSVESWVKRLRKKTAINFHVHMFRHTYATTLVRNGISTKALQELVGHAQIQTTMDTYVHLSEKDIREQYDTANRRAKRGGGCEK
ncbi:tyrosine-type recombinase/integrase [Alicyclobacillus dauci]|uniref:Site-specific integrase n=1 Tax=Alicyclobacillus dauci TaxID=1475485 RepID=A0ABY6Z118_9BACL|nr:tyrosine-type recombinase/integrase [Alicyclobacillus dauci]WAH36414.1 site-specific integrase [Alicyclobacillus dauci]